MFDLTHDEFDKLRRRRANPLLDVPSSFCRRYKTALLCGAAAGAFLLSSFPSFVHASHPAGPVLRAEKSVFSPSPVSALPVPETQSVSVVSEPAVSEPSYRDICRAILSSNALKDYLFVDPDLPQAQDFNAKMQPFFEQISPHIPRLSKRFNHVQFVLVDQVKGDRTSRYVLSVHADDFLLVLVPFSFVEMGQTPLIRPYLHELVAWSFANNMLSLQNPLIGRTERVESSENLVRQVKDSLPKFSDSDLAYWHSVPTADSSVSHKLLRHDSVEPYLETDHELISHSRDIARQIMRFPRFAKALDRLYSTGGKIVLANKNCPSLGVSTNAFYDSFINLLVINSGYSKSDRNLFSLGHELIHVEDALNDLEQGRYYDFLFPEDPRVVFRRELRASSIPLKEMSSLMHTAPDVFLSEMDNWRSGYYPAGFFDKIEDLEVFAAQRWFYSKQYEVYSLTETFVRQTWDTQRYGPLAGPSTVMEYYTNPYEKKRARLDAQHDRLTAEIKTYQEQIAANRAKKRPSDVLNKTLELKKAEAERKRAQVQRERQILNRKRFGQLEISLRALPAGKASARRTALPPYFAGLFPVQKYL